ncbi:MAG: NUDIX domain-containing protein, partial [Gammaproteobacteria bacterium]|nr:NUDIX domain-containing protein [Gammaproteobacteria bacterium]
MSVSHELLDVVDENDNIIAVKTRGEIHAECLMHRAVHILVFNSAGELFLQKRSLSKDEQPGKWDSSAAGHVDSGES